MHTLTESERYYNDWHFTNYPSGTAYSQLTTQQQHGMRQSASYLIWRASQAAWPFQRAFWQRKNK
ncbi:hypothetical protein CLV58_15410 [Spirosoma oryzae]|uniref:Uncharacterized protein n=1 Tax=Spirosoma oryzae TaxID=1469603 RepID=A0A2T0RIL8_9BACT|nr:hypothetical protein CLV58_15410 [Spirosoma oryzae]